MTWVNFRDAEAQILGAGILVYSEEGVAGKGGAK